MNDAEREATEGSAPIVEQFAELLVEAGVPREEAFEVANLITPSKLTA